MNSIQLDKMSDLELAELSMSANQEAMRVNANLQAIAQEITRRKPTTKENLAVQPGSEIIQKEVEIVTEKTK